MNRPPHQRVWTGATLFSLILAAQNPIMSFCRQVDDPWQTHTVFALRPTAPLKRFSVPQYPPTALFFVVWLCCQVLNDLIERGQATLRLFLFKLLCARSRLTLACCLLRANWFTTRDKPHETLFTVNTPSNDQKRYKQDKGSVIEVLLFRGNASQDAIPIWKVPS